MNPHLCFFLVASLTATLLSSAETASESRQWTAAEGRTYDGAYLSSTEEKVKIRMTDGTIFEMDRDALSIRDQVYVLDAEEAAKDAAKEAAKPKDEKETKAKKDPESESSGRSRKFNFASKPGFVEKMLLGYQAGAQNFGDPWPKEVGVDAEPEISVVEENQANHHFVYESPHYHFESNVMLKPGLLAKVALMFESTFKMHHDSPLNNRRTRAEKAGKLKARMFETSAEYHAAGGPGGSAGVYMGGNVDEFLVPLDVLGVKKVGSGYMFDFSGDFHTMFHELTHQMWADTPDLAGMWMVEGFAEFMACAPFSSGKFSFTKQQSYLMDYALKYGKRDKGGRDLGKDIEFPHLKAFMSWDQPMFYSNGNANYGMGLLLTDFFVTMDGEGDKVGEHFKNCIRACQAGKSEEEAREVLLAGRSYEDLERDFAAAMKKKGVKITYGD